MLRKQHRSTTSQFFVLQKGNTMLGILNFIKSMRNHVSKEDVMKDLEVTEKELSSYGIHCVHVLAEQARLSPFKSEMHKKFETEFYSAIKMSKKPANVYIALESTLGDVLGNLQELAKQARDGLEGDTLRDGITAKAAHLIRSTASISFISRYVLDFTDVVVDEETAEATGEKSDTPPIEYEYLMKKMQEFCRLLADYSIPLKDFKKILEGLPDVYLSQDNASTSMFRGSQLDPFANSILMSNFTGNPIYHIRMMWLSWEMERYQKAKDTKVVLELRLIHLKNVLEKSPNPMVEKEIEGVTKRIRAYDRKIREIEDSVR